ncbi:hypothetical protein M408DRAFT_8346 [Serendipita vermifera MAFF 305830]|uniref:Uncharacterized protein n=1 Tax=Serendipita vermifera MAFF 305830 TaxID=933852 RepID=A0A0C2WT49_SERVB|nr:hypothetical protein M408DRAFT_8346 [Serendipita vermifera MAFF 305830]
MWNPANIHAIPTQSDLLDARKTILTLEEELRLAELRVETLKNELKTLKAWTAPVRRLPFEIMSPIFALCGEMDWKSPLFISAVCRAWRKVVVDTPEAWFLINVKTQKNINLFEIYLAGCCQRLLHSTLQLASYLPNLASYTHGIQSIQVPDLPESMENLCFPNLKSLRISSETSRIRLTQVAASHFPVMRRLEVAGTLIDPWDVSPALKQLEDQSTLPNLGTIEFIVDSSSTAPTDDWVKQHRPKLNLIISERTIESWAPWPYYRGIFVTPPNVIYPP